MKVLKSVWLGAAVRLVPAVALSVAAVAAHAQAAPRVALNTSEGRIVIELNPAQAPVSAENFLGYVKKGHYDGTVFHRVIDGFMIQGGGMDRSMKERPVSAPIVNEAKNGLKNMRGTVAMARTGVVNSATAQFFINVSDNDFLNHVASPPPGVPADRVYGYAVFGKVVEGMDVVDKIRKVQTTDVGPFQNVPAKPVVIEKATLVSAK